jgi:hypothetical protein
MPPTHLDDRALLDACAGADGRLAAERLARAIDPGARSLGRRDAALVDLYGARYGSLLLGIADCPLCGEASEVSMEIALLRAREDPDGEFTVSAGDWEVAFRLPGPEDVAAARDERDLAGRCVLEVIPPRDGAASDAVDLPDEALDAMSARMEQLHPSGDIEAALACPSCAHNWTGRIDVAALVGARATADALLVMDEVHALARAYGWSEAEILDLPRERRRAYLERVLA